MNANKQHRGFSLLEVIISLVLAGLLASALVTFFDRNIIATHVPFQRLQNATQMSNAMEAIVKDYETMTTHSSSDLSALATKVNAFSTNYGTYCPSCTGRAATTSVGLLTDSVLVTLTNPAGETTYHLFTVQDY